MWKSAGHTPSLRVLLWHLPYNWEKVRKNLSQGKKNLSQGNEHKPYSILWKWTDRSPVILVLLHTKYIAKALAFRFH